MAVKINKKSQITIFIILGIILVAAVVIYFALRGDIRIPGIHPRITDFSSEMEKCVSDNTLKAVNIMLPQGGLINPEHYKLYKDSSVEYLCYTNLYYKPCINQHPMYLNDLSGEIKNYISGKVEDCFYNLQQEYQSKGYNVNMQATNMNVILNPKQINVVIDKKIDVSKNNEAKSYSGFNIKVNSPLYDLAMIASKIVADEAKYCYFESLGNNLLYPDYLIEKTNVGYDETSSKIYSITEKFSGKTLLIAIRGCALHGGLQ